MGRSKTAPITDATAGKASAADVTASAAGKASCRTKYNLVHDATWRDLRDAFLVTDETAQQIKQKYPDMHLTQLDLYDSRDSERAVFKCVSERRKNRVSAMMKDRILDPTTRRAVSASIAGCEEFDVVIKLLEAGVKVEEARQNAAFVQEALAAKAKADADTKLKADAEAKAKADAEAKAKADAEAKAKAETEAERVDLLELALPLFSQVSHWEAWAEVNRELPTRDVFTNAISIAVHIQNVHNGTTQ